MQWQSKGRYHWVDEDPYSARVEKTDNEESGKYYWVTQCGGKTIAARYSDDLSKAMAAAELSIKVTRTIKHVAGDYWV